MAAPAAAAPALDISALRAELHISETFSPEVEAAAVAAAAAGPLPVPAGCTDRVDRTDIPLITIDPAGSRDLDQALHIEERAGLLRLFYAITDVGAFVPHGSALELEAWRRGVTAYAPDLRCGVYPPCLSEGAISLLADGAARPAFLFTADVDGASGDVVAFDVERAMVRSRRKMTYDEAQRELHTYGCLPLMERMGRLRLAHASRRGAAQIDLKSQRPRRDAAAPGGYSNEWETRLPIEDWNAELSLLTGMGAAQIMIAAGSGMLRVMADPDPARLAAARAAAGPLGLSSHWPKAARVADVVASLHGAEPHQAALLTLLRRSMGGARYAHFEGARLPVPAAHYALAANYAHVTAPLRRLADRYVLEHVAALADARRRAAAAGVGPIPAAAFTPDTGGCTPTPSASSGESQTPTPAAPLHVHFPGADIAFSGEHGGTVGQRIGLHPRLVPTPRQRSTSPQGSGGAGAVAAAHYQRGHGYGHGHGHGHGGVSSAEEDEARGHGSKSGTPRTPHRHDGYGGGGGHRELPPFPTPVPAADPLARLRQLPAVMDAATQRAGRLESRIVDAVSVCAMRPRVGEAFSAAVLWADGSGCNIIITKPATITWMRAAAPEDVPAAGEVITVRLVGVDVHRGYLHLEPIVPVAQSSEA